MRFLFRLDLSLHAGAGNFFWNLEFCNQTRLWSTCNDCSTGYDETQYPMAQGQPRLSEATL